jgi:catechol 2,3-dioxygenase-like lactoylglutathione lyase family enzyme
MEDDMKLKVVGVMVADQDRALEFYTGTLGLVVRQDLKVGPYRFLTVGSPDGGVELLLEKTDFPPAADYQAARFAAGIPLVAIESSDIEADYRKLSDAGVTFRGEPTDHGLFTAVAFEDGCGNLVNLVQAAA